MDAYIGRMDALKERLTVALRPGSKAEHELIVWLRRGLGPESLEALTRMVERAQVVELTAPCPNCGGTLLPDEGSLHLDADGSAAIDAACGCGLESVTYFTWDAPEEESPWHP